MAGIYSALGLTKNPFAWVDNEDPGPFLDHLNLETPEPGASRLLQLVGPKGAGKSTHLKHWQSLTGGPYYYVPPEGAADPPLGPIVYWDEADRIGDRQLKQLFISLQRSSGTIVAGTHRDLSKPAAAAGLVVDTVEFLPLQSGVLAQWCQARIDKASPGKPIFVIPEGVLEQTCRAAKASLREAGDLLHVWTAQLAREAARSDARGNRN